MDKGKDFPEEFSLNMDFGNMFKGLGNLINLVNKMVDEDKTEINQQGEITGSDKNKGIRGMYSFSIKTGLGDSPKVQSFGNIKKKKSGRITVQEAREPIVDIFDEEDRLLIIVELPGVKEEDIILTINEDKVTIAANGKDRKYVKEILPPAPIDPEKSTSIFKHGILELTILKNRNNSG